MHRNQCNSWNGNLLMPKEEIEMRIPLCILIYVNSNREKKILFYTLVQTIEVSLSVNLFLILMWNISTIHWKAHRTTWPHAWWDSKPWPNW